MSIVKRVFLSIYFTNDKCIFLFFQITMNSGNIFERPSHPRANANIFEIITFR